MSTTSTFQKLGRVSKGRTGKYAIVLGVIVLGTVAYGLLTSQTNIIYSGLAVGAIVGYIGYKAYFRYVQRKDYENAAEELGVDRSAVASAAEHHGLSSQAVAKKPLQVATTADILDSMEITDVRGRISRDREEEMREREEDIEEFIEDRLNFMAEQAIEKELGPPVNRTDYDGNPLSVGGLDPEQKRYLAKLYLEDHYQSKAIKNISEGNLKSALKSAAIESFTGVPETPELKDALNLHYDPPREVPYRIEITDLGVQVPFNLQTTVSIDSDLFERPLNVGDVLTFDITLAKEDSNEQEITGCKISDVTNVRFVHENEEPVLRDIKAFEEEINEIVDSLRRANELQDDGVLTEAEYQDQFEDFLSKAQSISPQLDTMHLIERLNIYHDAGTISETSFQEMKTLLLDPQSAILDQIQELEMSGVISESELNQARQHIV